MSTSVCGLEVVITGALPGMTRARAARAIEERGGRLSDKVHKRTDVLVVADNSHCTTIRGGRGEKQRAAERFNARGAHIRIIGADDLASMLRA